MPSRPLTPVEARVLATLMEKARTVPDSYPLTLNSVVSGCNQKTARDPVMQVTDGQAQEALDSLRGLTLAFDTSGGRATRWEHNAERGLGVPGAAAAILGILMLRGPQTAGEIRIHTERWHRFADISSVEAFLDELANKPDDRGGPMVMQLPRQAGSRESRWVHLLCGAVDPADFQNDIGMADSAAAPSSALAARVAALEEAVEALRAEIASMRFVSDQSGGG
ncbi:YceH family protein [Xylophilus sp. GOD-11R]|uniref:YceH family protein n=1 Tax=Xylophilus sp. GOD-11R TaxID=3089814 RepID=UPI00298CB8A3|nr:YceH family protein [Xylophilus sp. GOD-11R]WPB55698.1 YceH family protein [Xylophilus sp. GOD-11R]